MKPCRCTDKRVLSHSGEATGPGESELFPARCPACVDIFNIGQD
jgi:hypothetical protein